jgi:hypothetical protein
MACNEMALTGQPASASIRPLPELSGFEGGSDAPRSDSLDCLPSCHSGEPESPRWGILCHQV